MQITKRKGLALLVVAALAGSATTALSASGHGGHGPRGPHHPIKILFRHHAAPVLATTMAPSNPGDHAINGVNPGSVPWKLKFGAATILSNGRVVVALKGLLITGTGTANDNTVGPVTAVDAALYCNDGTTATATTPSVPLTPSGNALINAKVALPPKCEDPTLLVNPTVNGAVANVFIAANGFGM